MSRSYKKTIAYGKSTSTASRPKKTWGDFAADKARKEGKPIRKQHWRHDLQTSQDYLTYVQEHFRHADIPYGSHDMFDRKNWEDYQLFIKEHGGVETTEIQVLFSLMLYNKAKSK